MLLCGGAQYCSSPQGAKPQPCVDSSSGQLKMNEKALRFLPSREKTDLTGGRGLKKEESGQHLALLFQSSP